MSKVNHGGHKGVEICVSWQPASGGKIPPHAVEAGPGCFVGRARHNGHWTPAKVVQGHQNAYLAYGDKEHAVSEYEVLACSDIGCYGKGYKWVATSGNNVPKKALVAGQDNGVPLYIARGKVNGECCVGKVHQGYGHAYFAWGGKEHVCDSYEILVLDN